MPNDQSPATNKQVENVAQSVAELLVRLHSEAGIPFEVVMAAAHGQVVTMLASIAGGEIAAQRCENAAKHVRSMPRIADAMLAAVTPHGSA